MGPNHLLWLCFICALCQGHCFHLRVMRLQMSNEEGAGMDGGFLETIGGGDFEMKICTSNEQVTSDRLGHNGGGDTYTMDCCHTGNLNTAVDNWERGQHNFFIGRQLGACEDFRQALFLDTCFDYFSCCYSTPHIGVPAFFPFLFLKLLLKFGQVLILCNLWQCQVTVTHVVGVVSKQKVDDWFVPPAS